jgi:hypothetical protein
MDKLESTAKLADVIARVNALAELVANPPKRDRGPASSREMTDDDARRVVHGDLKDAKHKAAAEALGLSYGQVYSARIGATFKAISREKSPVAE